MVPWLIKVETLDGGALLMAARNREDARVVGERIKKSGIGTLSEDGKFVALVPAGFIVNVVVDKG